MRLLETLQEYDFDIEYYPGARNYIQDALSRCSNHKKAPIPRLSTKQPPTTLPPSPLTTELLPILASAIQADEWLERLRQEYKTYPYFADVLTALGSQDTPPDDSEVKRRQRAKRAK